MREYNKTTSDQGGVTRTKEFPQTQSGHYIRSPFARRSLANGEDIVKKICTEKTTSIPTEIPSIEDLLEGLNVVISVILSKKQHDVDEIFLVSLGLLVPRQRRLAAGTWPWAVAVPVKHATALLDPRNGKQLPFLVASNTGK